MLATTAYDGNRVHAEQEVRAGPFYILLVFSFEILGLSHLIPSTYHFTTRVLNISQSTQCLDPNAHTINNNNNNIFFTNVVKFYIIITKIDNFKNY